MRALTIALAFVLGACAGGAAPTEGPTEAPTAGETATPAGTLTSPVAPTDQPTSSPDATAQAPSPTAAETASPTLGFDDPLAWSAISVAGGPSPREYHTFTVDGSGSAAYLFGGRAGQQGFDELWRYDLAADTWELIEPVGVAPAARFGHVTVWVEGMGLVLWSGQQSARVFFGDIWVFDPATAAWQELPDAGEVPEARYGSCGSIGPDGRLWISHGFTEDTGRFADTRAYDFETLSWADETPAGDVPVLRCLHNCLWSPDGELVLYGGQTTGAPAIGDLWHFDPLAGAWTMAQPPSASARQLYALAQIDERAFIFGGGGPDGELLDDLWLLDLASLTMAPAQLDSAQSPVARLGATLIADEARQRLLLFGGKGQAGELADLWVLAPAQP